MSDPAPVTLLLLFDAKAVGMARNYKLRERAAAMRAQRDKVAARFPQVEFMAPNAEALTITAHNVGGEQVQALANYMEANRLGGTIVDGDVIRAAY